MRSKYTEEQIMQFINLYKTGTKTSILCRKHNVPSSTLYYWVNKYRIVKKTTNEEFTVNDIYLLKKRMKKMEIENRILKECECTANSTRKEKLGAIARLDGKYSIHALCRALNILRSTYYHYKLRRPEQTMLEKEDKKYKEIINGIFIKSKGRLGAKKICAIMVRKGYKTTPKRITRLMREMNLVCISRKKKPHYNHSPERKYRKNKLKREFNTDRPNKVWVSDITNVNLNYEPYYLCTVIDLFSRKVIAYNISDNKETDLVMETFEDAYNIRKPNEDLMFHSDQGIQYTSYTFRKRLRDLKVDQSFSEPGCPHDNAVAESFFRTFKAEEVYQKYYKTYEHMESSIEEYISFFNGYRPHQSFKYLTPNQIEEKYYQE